ncbi:MAG TPA: hypothetical protein VF789_14585 [Thermoanaerobaculia bacterium]
MARKALSLAVGCLLVLPIFGCKKPLQESVPPQVRDGFDQCQGDSFKIDLLNVLDTLPDSSVAARTEQLRDWVWRTVLARLAARGAGPELLASIARQPLLRDETLAHILDVPVGRGRTAVDKEGTVYVLVDRSSPRRTREDALEAIDQEALLLGEMPKRVEVYGMTIKRSTAEAEVCRLGSFDQGWARSPRKGFRHARVTTAEGLAGFLEGGVDLLSASCTAGGLELTGRVRARGSRAPVTVEHIAALHASPAYVPVDRLLVEIPPEARSRAEEMGDQIDEALRLVEQGAPLPRGADLESERFLARLFEWKQRYPLVPTADLILSLQAQMSGLDNLGFSLDPRTDPLQKSGYQCARYDGPVAGTKAAMTMFYTDLLAKLWAINWRNAAPTGLVPGFVSVAEHPGASTYCEQDEGVPYTRIWFGSRQEGFLRDEQDKLRFAPNATRLFALGSAAGPEQSAEVEPAADMLRFIRWWDRNYSSMAEWEPQYELLNQLVKWTLVQRMAQAAPSNCLSFLDQVQPERTERFDRWLAVRKDLRWQGPLPLVDKPHEKTECLDLFQSSWFGRCGNLAKLSGGVGLPAKEEYASRPVRARDPRPYVRRIDAEKQAIQAPDGTLRFSSIDRPKGSLEEAELTVTADRAQLTGQLTSDISLRGDLTARVAETTDGTYGGRLAFRQEDRLVDGGNGLRSEEAIENFGVLRLSATDLRKGRVQLKAWPGAKPMAERMAQDLVRQASVREDFPTTAQRIAGDIPVFAVSPNEVIVHLRPAEGGEGAYAVLSSGGGVRGPPNGGGPWITGNADPSRRDRNDGRGGRWNSKSVSFALLTEKEGKEYIQRQGAEPVVASDPVVGEVREKLSRGDLEAARALAEKPGAPAWAAASVASSSIKARRFGVAEDMVRRLKMEQAREQAEAGLRRIERSLAEAQIELARTQNDSPDLLAARKLQVVVALEIRRLATEDAERWRTRHGETSAAIVFASARYPKDAVLPPVAHRPGRLLPLRERYVLDVIEEVERVLFLDDSRDPRSQLPAAVEIDGVSLRLRESPVPAQQGSPRRGFDGDESEPIPPILFVRPCTIEAEGTPGLPSCYRPVRPAGAPADPIGPAGPGNFEDEGPLDIYLMDCDRDGDGRLDEESERDCAEAKGAEAKRLQPASFEP